jgi:hypothetical protein
LGITIGLLFVRLIASGLYLKGLGSYIEPIDKPVLTALNLPYKENFNDRKPELYCLEQVQGTIDMSLGSGYFRCCKMSGSNVAGSSLGC